MLQQMVAPKQMKRFLNKKNGWMRSLLSKQTSTKYILVISKAFGFSSKRQPFQAFESHIFNPEVGTLSAALFMADSLFIGKMVVPLGWYP